MPKGTWTHDLPISRRAWARLSKPAISVKIGIIMENAQLRDWEKCQPKIYRHCCEIIFYVFVFLVAPCKLFQLHFISQMLSSPYCSDSWVRRQTSSTYTCQQRDSLSADDCSHRTLMWQGCICENKHGVGLGLCETAQQYPCLERKVKARFSLV